MGYRFCPDCGTTLIKETEAPEFKLVYLVQAGTADSGDALVTDKPDAELWTSRRAEWLVPVPGAEQKSQFA